MKLHIDKKESSEGLIFKKKVYEMFVRAEMTPEERQAYNSVKDEIGHMIIAEYSYKGTELNFTISSLVYTHDKKGDGSRFAVSAAHQLSPLEDQIKKGVAGFSSYLKKVMAGGNTGNEVLEF